MASPVALRSVVAAVLFFSTVAAGLTMEETSTLLQISQELRTSVAGHRIQQGPSNASNMSLGRAANVTSSSNMSLGRAANVTSSCSPLRNRGSHFTVEIEVGTPGQKFDVVADTGSDNVIVADCSCVDSGRCRPEDKCFNETAHSSTFLIKDRESELILTFGSGQIGALMATDVVKVGEVATKMESGVLLMVDQALSISGAFEGILGLGLPRSTGQDLEAKTPSPFAPRPAQPGSMPMKGFLEQAGIGRFSMCFNENAGGVLRLGTPLEEGALNSIGQFHWGLDFRGISVGDATTPVGFCTNSSMKPGQETPCGAIPDSGTTLMMGAAHHLKLLFADLCDKWPRCSQQAPTSQYSKYELFQVLLLHCEEWMTRTEGMNELPPMYLQFAGKSLKLAGNTYVFITRQEEMESTTQNLFGVFPLRIALPTGRMRNVCIPAFGSHKYDTLRNGPVWILGTPLFYDYHVAYDLKATPPTITFVDKPCGSCAAPSLLASDATLVSKPSSRHMVGRPLEVHGPMRMPSLNTSTPL